MNELEIVLKSDFKQLISALEKFQVEIIEDFLIKSNGDYLASADLWLNAGPSQTAGFGGEGNKAKIYREKLFDELEKFICGDPRYEEDRKKLEEGGDKTIRYVIAAMSTAIGPYIGTAGPFIAPVIVLLISSGGAMAKNAWCEMRKQLKDEKTK